MKKSNSIKRIFLSLIIGTIFINTRAQEVNIYPILPEDIRNGSINSIVTTRYRAVDRFGEISLGAIISKEYAIYNSSGDVKERGRIKEDGSKFLILENTYDSATKRLIKITTYDQYVDYKRVSSVVIIKYGLNGKVETESVYNEWGELTDQRVHEYDGYGHRVAIYGYNSKGEKVFTRKIKYNNGRIIEIDGAGITTTIGYDNQGKINMVMNTMSMWGGSSAKYVYDSAGRFARCVSGNYEDVYCIWDSHGNWTRMESQKSDSKIVETITIRTIEY